MPANPKRPRRLPAEATRSTGDTAATAPENPGAVHSQEGAEGSADGPSRAKKGPCPVERLFCRNAGKQPATPAAGSPASVPGELTCEMGGRMALAALGAASVGGVMTAVAAVAGRLTLWSGLLGGALVLGSLATVACARVLGCRSRGLPQCGSAFLLLASLAFSLLEASTLPGTEGLGGVSWNAVWVAFFPLVVPTSPRRTLVRALLGASMTPLAFALVASRMTVVPSTAALVLYILPAYVAAMMAFAASRFINRLGDDLREARKLGLYELEEPIAQGGMGEVWRARHRFLARPAAIKLIRPHAGGSSAGPGGGQVSARRFEREAQVTASLESPHTVQLYDFGVTDDGTLYYVMELLDGTDLEKLVRNEGPQHPRRVVRIMEQVLDSLGEAHARGLIHRDIKPANIHLSTRGLHKDFVKVLDFGLVKRSQKLVQESLTLSADNEISGTPAYMAPELVTGEGPLDGRADLYALGCVAYWLLTGRLVFEAGTPMAMAIAHAAQTPVSPSERAGVSVPASLEALVLACLAKRPEDRPASAQALLNALEEIEGTLGAEAEQAPGLRAPVVRHSSMRN
jgi:serine/threonine-protein kinase